MASQGATEYPGEMNAGLGFDFGFADTIALLL